MIYLVEVNLDEKFFICFLGIFVVLVGDRAFLSFGIFREGFRYVLFSLLYRVFIVFNL